MRKIISLAVAVSMVVVLGQIGLASSFKILGTRPLGMGGAFVAVAEDAIAQYWNPAGFALQKGFDIQIPVGVGIETTEGLLKEVDDLGKIAKQVNDIQEKQKKGEEFDKNEIKTFTLAIKNLDDLSKPGLGLVLDINAGLNIRYGNLGIGVINITELGADPYLDLVNIGLGVSTGPVSDALNALCVDIVGDGKGDVAGALSPSQQSIANSIASSLDGLGVAPTKVNGTTWTNQELAEELVVAGVLARLTNDEIEAVASAIVEGLELWDPLIGTGFGDNKTNIRLNGIMLFEAPVTYALELPWLKNLYVGGNFKFMYGMVGFAEFRVFEDEDLMESLYKDYKEYTEASTTIGVDIGALYDLKESCKVRFGMVVRNLTYPSFSQPKEAKEAGLGKYVIEPQVRVGVAYWPLNFITLSADWDLTNNKTALQGYYSKMLSLGAEVNIFNRSWLNFALRGGFMDNLAESSGSMFTAGLGLNIFHFQLDFAAAMSTKTTRIADSQKFPTALTGSVGLSFNF